MPTERIAPTELELLRPEQTTLQSAVHRAMAQPALSPWEQFKVAWEVKRRQAEVVTRLVALEADAVVAEAVIETNARLEVKEAQAAVGQLQEKFDCLFTAGRLRDEAVKQGFELTEGSREVVQDAIDRVFMGTVARIECRTKHGRR